jgi:hypothetical protein
MVRVTRSPLRDARTAVSFAWMNVTAVIATTAALLPLAWRGRPLGGRRHADVVLPPPLELVPPSLELVPPSVELQPQELRSAGQV